MTRFSNLAIVDELFARMRRRDVDAISELLHDTFVSHNPRVPHNPSSTTGREAFTRFLRSPDGQRLLAAEPALVRTIADDEFVWVHTHLQFPDNAGAATVDVLRLADGLIAEHWDVVQPVAEAPANPHGMF